MTFFIISFFLLIVAFWVFVTHTLLYYVLNYTGKTGISTLNKLLTRCRPNMT